MKKELIIINYLLNKMDDKYEESSLAYSSSFRCENNNPKQSELDFLRKCKKDYELVIDETLGLIEETEDLRMAISEQLCEINKNNEQFLWKMNNYDKELDD